MSINGVILDRKWETSVREKAQGGDVPMFLKGLVQAIIQERHNRRIAGNRKTCSNCRSSGSREEDRRVDERVREEEWKG